MPKIVDRQAMKRQIAEQAVNIFSKRGFHGIGMRELASELNMSKSALYHYFESKQALFLACTEVVSLPVPSNKALSDQASALDQVVALFMAMEQGFEGEVRLLLDYIRDLDNHQRQEDPALKLALNNYRQSLQAMVGEEHADALLYLFSGFLLLRLLSGQPLKVEQVTDWVTRQVPELAR